MASNTYDGVTLSEMGLAYSIPVFYSTNVWVKFFIAERYRRRHYVWCSEGFDISRQHIQGMPKRRGTRPHVISIGNVLTDHKTDHRARSSDPRTWTRPGRDGHCPQSAVAPSLLSSLANLHHGSFALSSEIFSSSLRIIAVWLAVSFSTEKVLLGAYQICSAAKAFT